MGNTGYDNILLLTAGFIIGTLGTLIGAGGGFILVPVLILAQPELSPEIITAISIAIVAANAVSGSVAYARSGRIDFKAGLVFTLAALPGSVLGVYSTAWIPQKLFHIFFGLLLIVLSVLLFIKKNTAPAYTMPAPLRKGWKHHILTDKEGITYEYAYNQNKGIFISAIVGYLSPLLGIGGGIIHVPALANWLRFPVHIATATSHFILAIMSVVSVVVHALKGNYSNPFVLHMVLMLGIGVVIGAQVGALLSHKIQGNKIIRALAICLAIVGLRILLES
ncbi:sulfite exporter TauE/SafE family protein [Foetidibacter luteolus]|uniref:sulfite exporter TauE/SafE family protein n=1 Tax=Foetidibacter luteolus TaxID=2608880 RepID=UPI00129B66D2|nr:sulfite exporter TauE/SafE family protein [Foetidibacter luteolus]